MMNNGDLHNNFLQLTDGAKYRVGEVCNIVGIRPYVLRFWESEFVEISPIASSDGQKIYSVRDLKYLKIIKKLLFEKKMNIVEAKKALFQLKEVDAFEKNMNKTSSVILDNKQQMTSSFAPLTAQTAQTTQTTLSKMTPLAVPVKKILSLEDEKKTQKLILAKAKMASIVSMAQEIKKTELL